jgi:hypothetical protein
MEQRKKIPEFIPYEKVVTAGGTLKNITSFS